MTTRGWRKGFWGWMTATLPTPKPGTPAWTVEKWVTAVHVWVFRRSRGRLLARFDGAPLCVLHHRGAKTGVRREAPIIHLRDGERVIIVASIGGNPRNPAWFHNIKAHPDVEIDTGGRRLAMRARVAGDAERAELWPRLLEMWPAWSDYQAKTTRIFPVVICEPR